MSRYRGRVSGPLLDRIDLVVEVPVETKDAMKLWQARSDPTNETAVSAERVAAAREFALASRSEESPNSRLEGRALLTAARLSREADRLLADATSRWSLSARAVHRTLRVARTVADFAASEQIAAEAIGEALSFRHETLRVEVMP